MSSYSVSDGGDAASNCDCVGLWSGVGAQFSALTMSLHVMHGVQISVFLPVQQSVV